MVATREAVALRGDHRLDDHVDREVRALARVREVEREITRLVAQERVDDRRDHLARWHLRHLGDLAQLGELGLVVVDPDLPVGDRGEADVPPLPPLGLFSEESRKELDEVAVARARQHAETLEQRELYAVAGHEIALGELGGEIAQLAPDHGREVNGFVGQLLGIGESFAQAVRWRADRPRPARRQRSASPAQSTSRDRPKPPSNVASASYDTILSECERSERRDERSRRARGCCAGRA